MHNNCVRGTSGCGSIAYLKLYMERAMRTTVSMRGVRRIEALSELRTYLSNLTVV
jgi:hypothetical protein